MSNYVRRGAYIVPAHQPNRYQERGRDGQRIYRAGCDLSAAMYPTEPDRNDPGAGLIAELEQQIAARRQT